MMKRIALAMLFALFAIPAYAACSGSSPSLTAASASESDVQACLTLAVAGDTIHVPAGSSTWTSTMTVTIGVSIIGAGTSSTIITDATNEGGVGCAGPNYSLMDLFLIADQAVRVSNIRFIGQAPTDVCGESAGMFRVTGTSQFRLDHNQITAYVTATISYGAYGVIDHNLYDGPYTAFQTLVQDTSYGGVGLWGDNSWAQPDTFGTATALYIEDNTYALTGVGQRTGCFDSEGGGRLVFRFNTGCSFVGNHGLDSSARTRSARQFEIYNNSFTSSDTGIGNQYTAIFLRGGTGRIFSNDFVDLMGSPYSTLIQPTNYRDTNNFWKPWGNVTSILYGCDGRGLWDTNIGTTYDSGTYNGAGGTPDILTDTLKSWTTNQWQGYSVINLVSGRGSTVISNTATTITLDAAAQHEPGGPPDWVAGNGYEIRKAYPCADQVGRGAGGYVSGGDNDTQPTPATAFNQAQDPLYSFLNTHNGGSPTAAINIRTQHIQLDRDVFDWVALGSFDGTAGVSSGTRSQRPSSTTNFVSFWSTDAGGNWDTKHGGANDGCLDEVVSGAWVDCAYKPYTYPHPLAPEACSGASKLLFSAQPSSVGVGVALGTVTVGVYDSSDVLCDTATDTITIANKGGTCTGMTLGGTKSGAASSGIFTTTDLTENAAGACTLSATASGLTGADSSAFTISAVSGLGLTIRLRLKGFVN